MKRQLVCCFQYVLVDIDNFTAGWRSKDSLTHLYIENFHSKNLVSIYDSAIAKIYFEIFLKIELKFEFQNSKKWNGMIEIVFESREKWKFNTNNENKVLIWMFLWLEKRARLVSYQGHFLVPFLRRYGPLFKKMGSRLKYILGFALLVKSIENFFALKSLTNCYGQKF